MRKDQQVLSPFGQQLRAWRRRSGISQLELAAQAGTTPRYVSFIETGRARPGRELIRRLAAALDVPLRERNALMTAAGLTPAFPTRALSDAPMQPVSLVLEQVLRRHEPYPAWVVGRGLQFLAANCGAEALFPGLCAMRPEEIVDLWFGPGPFRDIVENWPEVIHAGVASLRREASRYADPELFSLLARAESHLRGLDGTEQDVESDAPTICPRLNINGHTVRTVSTVMRFDTAAEVTASELRVELLFPADEESDAALRNIIAGLFKRTEAAPGDLSRARPMVSQLTERTTGTMRH